MVQYPDPELWQEFFAVLATAAAALVGLFFVVSSLHLDRFANDRVLQRSAQNIAIVMMLLFLQALTVLVPLGFGSRNFRPQCYNPLLPVFCRVDHA